MCGVDALILKYYLDILKSYHLKKQSTENTKVHIKKVAFSNVNSNKVPQDGRGATVGLSVSSSTTMTTITRAIILVNRTTTLKSIFSKHISEMLTVGVKKRLDSRMDIRLTTN